MTQQQLLSVVVPVFNESAVVDAFHERTSRALASLPGFDYEIIFVDDGSRDDTYAKLAALATHDPHLRVIKFSRNFGHQIAITAGLDHAQGACVVIMDGDLQHPPEMIRAMIAKWQEGYDVVYGRRASRPGESRLKLVTATAFYSLLSRITSIEIPADAGDFRLISRRAADQLNALREKDRFVRGLVSWIGFRQIGLVYQQEPRLAGTTKYPFNKMMRFAIDGITSFSTIPLRLSTWLGYSTAFLAFAYMLDVVIEKALGMTVQGWATVMVAMLFLGGVQLICLGIVGEYLGRVFNELKSRPMYIIEEAIGTNQTSAPKTLRPGGSSAGISGS